jgi:hypothetical protein
MGIPSTTPAAKNQYLGPLEGSEERVMERYCVVPKMNSNMGNIPPKK